MTFVCVASATAERKVHGVDDDHTTAAADARIRKGRALWGAQLGSVAVSDIGTQVRDILAFHLGIDGSQLADDTRFEDLGADSLDVVEIVMSCEEQFSVVIPNREATSLATLGDAVRCVKTQVEAVAAAQLAAEKFSAVRPASRTHRLRAALTAK
ncbi:acyl carrier protein [Rhodospirillales bacterium URHD0017]|nr:acyl carrier protein [Rhodospirillales bacterium URHD0017]